MRKTIPVYDISWQYVSWAKLGSCIKMHVGGCNSWVWRCVGAVHSTVQYTLQYSTVLEHLAGIKFISRSHEY